MRQTTMFKNGERGHNWLHVDADGKILGRLAVKVAAALVGKHRPDYTPHVDTGDFVIVTNAEKIVMTGAKGDQNLKLRYSGYPGGQKAETYNQVRERKPEKLIEDAVRRMMPKHKLARHMLTKLKVYRGAVHPHQAQNPQTLEV
jgi:large subunit ribosomal protein L13